MKWRIVALLLVLAVPTLISAQNADRRAGLIVQFGDGRVVESCVHFSEDTISGEELLRRSGLPAVVQTGGLGAAVCQIDGEGCAYPQEPCFCACQGSDCAYWSLHEQIDGQWRYGNQGASAVTVADGTVLGWSWGAGSAAPPLRSFADICAVAAAPTAQVVPTTTVAATITVSPSERSSPTAAATVAPVAPPAGAGQGASYLVFALLLLGLGIVFVVVRRRSS